MTTPITFPQLEQKIRDLVTANPDFQYPNARHQFTHNCVYNQTSAQPPCIFGKAFAELGYPVPMKHEGNPIEHVLPEMLIGEISPADLLWAARTQLYQDKKEPWIDCLAKADKWRQKYLEEES